MSAVMEDIKAKNIELEQDRAKGIFDFIEMYNKYIAVRQDDLALCEAKVQAAVRETAKQKEVLKKAEPGKIKRQNIFKQHKAESQNIGKAMEKLKEKHLLDYAEYVKKQEMMQIDEINITRGYKEE